MQIDDPLLSILCCEEWTKQLREHGTDINRLFDLYIGADNRVLQDLPGDLNTGRHMCRGNIAGDWNLSGGYEAIAEKWFNKTLYKVFYLEYDWANAGDFTPLRHLPKGKAAVLGLVITNDANLEQIGEIKERLFSAADEIASSHGKERADALEDSLAVSTQCGFGTGVDLVGVGMTTSGQWQKMELL